MKTLNDDEAEELKKMMEMPESWHKLNNICRDPLESQIGREAAYLMKEMAGVLEEISNDTNYVWETDSINDQRLRAYDCFDKSSKKAGLIMEKFKEWK